MNRPYLAMEKFLVLFPDGSMRWIHCQHDQMVTCFRDSIGCTSLEHVTLPFGFGCVVDECGKIKPEPQPLNPYASEFYPGTAYGDPLVGPVVFVREGLYEGEWDWVPLQERDIYLIELILGKKVPQ